MNQPSAWQGRGLESRPTMKDAHSPAGQEFYAPANLADLPDCPRCKFGTPEPGKNDRMICIDCGHDCGPVKPAKR